MNRGGFSLRRFFGISRLISNTSRKIGIPLTRSGRQRKVGAALGCLIPLFLLLCLVLISCGSAVNRSATEGASATGTVIVTLK